MQLSLGIDTGGTYTDAVLCDDDRGVVATAKALTTRHDLAIGIAAAVEAVLGRADASAVDIALVSLSTTLATNALVEGRGGRVALIFIGFGEAEESRAGLAEAMDGDPILRISGGHDPLGSPLADLDLDALEREVLAVAPTVTGFAISAQFSTRNTSHEIAARDAVARLTGLPVTCGHELSAKLNGPRRALTSVLNARLIGLVTSLIDAARCIMDTRGIVAPLMVVRGDGSLMAAEMATARPIETILSGPAASLVGAAYLTGATDAVVSDIGGTTTDIAIVERGRPRLAAEGARVGGFHTMVEAVATTTIGLGGDSEVVVDVSHLTTSLVVGPRRLVPIALAASEQAELIHRVLDQQLLEDPPGVHDARFVLPIAQGGASTVGLDPAEVALYERSLVGASPEGSLVRTSADVRRLDRLVARGLVMLAGFTPTDASHVLGEYVAFDTSAATKAAALMARKRAVNGAAIAPDAATFAAWVVQTLRRRSAEALLEVGLEVDGFAGGHLSRHPLVVASLDGRRGVVDIAVRLAVPVVGLGASASLHYPVVADLLRAERVIPDHADVANAIGAVVGRVRVHSDVYVSQPQQGRFRIHHDGSPDVFSLAEALVRAAEIASAASIDLATRAGADHVEVVTSRHLNIVDFEGDELFVDGTVTATASGRPRLGHSSAEPTGQ